MITEYIGSAYDLKNCSKIAVIDFRYNLDKNSIEKYTLDYIRNNINFTFIELVNRDENGEFKIIVSTNFKFSGIIMYDSLSHPLGFTMLNQTIDTLEYKIETITFRLLFTIDVQDKSYIDIEIDNPSYYSHVINNRRVHGELFNSPSDAAMSVNQIDSQESNRSIFTNVLYPGNSEDYYRYSGDLLKDKNVVRSVSFKINTWNEQILNAFKTYRKRMIKVDNKYYFCMFSEDHLLIYSPDEVLPIFDSHFNFRIQDLGTNMMVVRVLNSEVPKYEVYATCDLIKGSQKLLTYADYESKDYPGFNLEFVRDLVSGDLVPYLLSPSKGLISLTQRMSDIIMRLDISVLKQSLIRDVIGIADNLFIYRDATIDSDDPRILIQSDVVHAPYPEELSEPMQYKTRVIETIQINSNDAYYLNSKKLQPGVKDWEDISPFIYELPFNDIVAISNKALLVQRTNGDWYLLTITPKIEETDQGIFMRDWYILKSNHLGHDNNWRKLSFLAHHKLNPRNLSLLMTPIDGRLWRLVTQDHYSIITAL